MEPVLWQGLSLFSMLAFGAVTCCCDGTQMQQQQQQQIEIENDDGPKRVCPECGLENPRSASHCGDCGFNFGGSNE